MDCVLVQNQSDSESVIKCSPTSPIPPPPKPKPKPQRERKRDRDWTIDQRFSSKDEAKRYVKDEGIWSQNKTNSTTVGRKVYYRCNKVKQCDKQCDAGLYLLFQNSSSEVILYRTEQDHTCHTIGQGKQSYGMSNDVKTEIKHMFELKIPPKKMLKELQKKNMPTPKNSHLNNFLHRLRAEKRRDLSDSINNGELEQWCELYPNDTDNVGHSYMFTQEVNNSEENDEKSFQVPISNTPVLQADAAYKANWEDQLRNFSSGPSKPAEPVPPQLSHIDAKTGKAKMVNIGPKPITTRTARAESRVHIGPEVMRQIESNTVAKGDVLNLAKTAAIMGSKWTGNLIPLCHQIPLDMVDITFRLDKEREEIVVQSLVSATYRTGVEMEAMTAVMVASLTIYDMCKSINKAIVIRDCRLVEKTGGKSGNYRSEAE